MAGTKDRRGVVYDIDTEKIDIVKKRLTKESEDELMRTYLFRRFGKLAVENGLIEKMEMEIKKEQKALLA